MFDFKATLSEAEEYSKKGDFAVAAFHYWLIGFAYEDEEFPYSWTPEIGDIVNKKLSKLIDKHHDAILASESYKKFKNHLSDFPNYCYYFENFEAAIH